MHLEHTDGYFQAILSQYHDSRAYGDALQLMIRTYANVVQDVFVNVTHVCG